MLQQARKQLDQTIEDLYTAFRRYRLHSHIEACPCCVGDADQRRIRSKPLRQLTADDLRFYSAKAMTTWGSADDFRHFLPRLFELTALSAEQLVDDEIVIGKLSYAGWISWPALEQAAVKNYLAAFWRYCLQQEAASLGAGINSVLCAISLVEPSLKPYLVEWESAKGPNPIRHLRSFLDWHWKHLLRGSLNPNWRNEHPENVREVYDWILHGDLIRHLELKLECDDSDEMFAAVGDATDSLSLLIAVRSPGRH